MPKSEIIDLTLCFISIVGLLVNCYLFYRNSKKFMETEDYSLSIFAFCNMGIVYGMLAVSERCRWWTFSNQGIPPPASPVPWSQQALFPR